jgi:hypothetical protein
MELTRIRRMRDAMILAERRKELIEMEVMQRQAAAMFVACSKSCTKKTRRRTGWGW